MANGNGRLFVFWVLFSTIFLVYRVLFLFSGYKIIDMHNRRHFLQLGRFSAIKAPLLMVWILHKYMRTIQFQSPIKTLFSVLETNQLWDLQVYTEALLKQQILCYVVSRFMYAAMLIYLYLSTAPTYLKHIIDFVKVQKCYLFGILSYILKGLQVLHELHDYAFCLSKVEKFGSYQFSLLY